MNQKYKALHQLVLNSFLLITSSGPQVVFQIYVYLYLYSGDPVLKPKHVCRTDISKNILHDTFKFIIVQIYISLYY